MLISAIIMWGLASVLAAVAIVRPGKNLAPALRNTRDQALMVLPRMPVTIVAAGFIAELIPQEAIGPYIGGDSGLIGILIAAAVGAVMPSGPVISFPSAIALVQLGAGTPQLVAFLTAWSTFAMHRMFLFEIPMMGWGFTGKRLLASVVLPPTAGVISWGMLAL